MTALAQIELATESVVDVAGIEQRRPIRHPARCGSARSCRSG